MYTPAAFRFDDLDEKISFMKRYSFASIISCIDAVPVATMLPFVIREESGRLWLSSHFAAANPQAKYIEDTVSLVIFAGPHGYISPKHYEKKEVVPTWDYISVHAQGKARILHDDHSKKQLLESMIGFYEESYLQQWQGLPERYIIGMMKGIVAFEIEITALSGKKKLSQNKTPEERNRIIAQLERSGNTVEKELAAYINDLP